MPTSTPRSEIDVVAALIPGVERVRFGILLLALCSAFGIGVVVGQVSAHPEATATPSAAAGRAERDDVVEKPDGSAQPVQNPTLTRPSADLQKLEAEVRRLRTLIPKQASEAETEGVAAAFPLGRGASSDEQALRNALRRSFAARGLAADVTTVDCAEFPCIAHGQASGAVEDEALDLVFNDARDAVGGEQYRWVDRIVNHDVPSKTWSAFHLAFYPVDLPDAEKQNLKTRLNFRTVSYNESFRE